MTPRLHHFQFRLYLQQYVDYHHTLVCQPPRQEGLQRAKELGS